MPVGQVQFELPANVMDQSKIDSIKSHFDSFDPPLRRYVFNLKPSESEEAMSETSVDPAHIKAQATEISKYIGSDNPPEDLIFGKSDLPGDCPGVSVVILIDDSQRMVTHMPFFISDSNVLVSSVAEAGFNFDNKGKLFLDRQYLKTVRVLKKRDIKINSLAFAGETKPEGEMAAKRIDSLYTALNKEGLVTEGAKKESLALAEHDRKVLNQGSLRFDNVFVARV